jgi:hypothetical protein
LSKKSLEIDENLAFQEREWRWERIGWILIALVLTAGVTGVFGHHPVTRVTNQTSNRQIVIDYERFGRNDSASEIIIHVTSNPHADKTVYLWINADYLDSINVTTISPWPVRGEAREGERAFVFQTDGTAFSVILSIQFHTIGLLHGRVKVNEQEVLSLTHMVWP